MKEPDISEICSIVAKFAPTGASVGPETKILSGLDLDSLKMLELVEEIKRVYGVDFMAPEHSMAELSTPNTIAQALAASGVEGRV